MPLLKRLGENSPADDRYGPRRLGALYEISKLLTHFVESTENTILTLLAVIAKEMPLQSVVLIEKSDEEAKTVVWHSPLIGPRDRRVAEARAGKAFSQLTGLQPPSSQLLDVPGVAPREPETADAPSRRKLGGRYITCPLSLQGRGVFGALHLEGSEAFEERDVEFVSAIADQLAIALERFHARLHEIALRKQAESSQRDAEREVVNRRRVEEEVRKLNQELERRVSERTAQYLETIGELHAFTYSVAHDLRAPLRHIHGFSKLLLASPDEQAFKGYARRIMTASEGMDTLIKDLLAYSRLTLDEVKFVPISLTAVLSKISVGMESVLRERKAELRIEASLPKVLGHEVMLIQAISNMISNALKYTAAGVEPRIVVRSEIRNKMVRLWVEDNGIGIKPEHQERIFGVFQRLHRHEEYPGTGIGLAIVRRALARMNGNAGVVSQLGAGSRFWIELARAPEAK